MQTLHRSAVLDKRSTHPAPARPKSMPSWLPDMNLSDMSLVEDDLPGIPLDNGYILEGPRRLKFVKFLGAGAFGCVFLAKNLDWVEPGSMSTGDIEEPSLLENQSLHLESSDAPASSFSYLPLGKPGKPEDASFSTIATFPSQPYYAVKCLENNTSTPNQHQREIQNHFAVQGHDGIVELYATVHSGCWTFLILEYVDGGDMLHSMAKQNIYATCDLRLREVFRQVIDAVQHCHQKGIYHRDLKPENIMCRDGKLKVALGDFGVVFHSSSKGWFILIARKGLSTTTRMSTTIGCGSAYYMSPECAGQGYLAQSLVAPAGWKPQPFDTSKNDVWCLGIVLFSMICGLTPWEKARESDVEFMHYLRHPLLLRQSLPISWRAFSLFLQIFDPNPETRITLDALEDEVRKIGTFRMTPWEIEASNPEIRRAAEAWLPDTPRPRSQWVRYETYPEHLDFPRPRSDVPSDPTPARPCESAESEDIVPCLDPCSEDETNPESALSTPEVLTGESVQDEEFIPGLDLADGLYAWSAGLEERVC
ncbi:unnamed protein product [Rhizoctonia solani]|uniref:Protein kinase domain-containing protein n=1 Tax=Rhizoctonia solani TaxID=456999 RepID=A0A8H3HNS3_9AGAM|nr:unnamed protein product [Rhizoctonia solani]